MDTEILLKIVAYRQEPRPIAWIARETGLDTRDVRAVLRVAGDQKAGLGRGQVRGVKGSGGFSEVNLDKYDRMEYLVSQGCSINEIVKTLGGSPATVKRWFPNAGVKKGSKEHQELAQMGRKMKEVERKK